MKTAIAQFPLVINHPAAPAAPAIGKMETQLTAKVRQQLVAYVCKGLVCVAGIGMIYCVISYGRIYQNYLQW